VDITNLRITAEDTPDPNWRFTVTYTATFTSAEAHNTPNQLFADRVRFWEWDVSDHDLLVDWTSERVFDPGAQSVIRTFVVSIPKDTIDTESGAEEVRAEIALRNHSIAGNWLTRFTSQISIGV